MGQNSRRRWIMAAGVCLALTQAIRAQQNSGPNPGPYEQTSFNRQRVVSTPNCINCAPGTSSPGTSGTPGTGQPGQGAQAGQPGVGAMPGAAADGNAPQVNFDQGAQASLAGTGGESGSALPQSIGDLLGYRAFRVVNSGNAASGPVISSGPIASRAGSGFKIADNESARPLDRIFFTYNYFDNAGANGIPNNAGVPASGINVHREMFGFEKTFLDGDASIGLRLPFYQSTGETNASGFSGSSFGDMTMILKFALLNDRETGNVFSTGLAVTFPTGPNIDTIDGNINSVLYQPYLGYIYTMGDAYIQGFSSCVIPTNTNDVTLLFNDIGVGYFAYRNYTPGVLLTAIVPTVECHVSTPLNHRGEGGAVLVSDDVVITGGVHFGIGRRSWLTFGAATPITGPRPFDIEAMCQYNFRF